MKAAIAILGILLTLLAPAARAVDALDMGFYLPGIRDTNLTDVKLTLQLWADELGKAHGIAAKAFTYDDMAALYRDSMGGKINLVVAPAMEIAEIFAPEELSQGFQGMHHGTGEGLALMSVSALHAATELNPQIGQRLRILLQWKTSALSYGRMPARTDAGLRDRVLNSAMKATTTVRGKQILELFKIDYMERVDIRELQPYWALHRQYRDDATRKARKK